MMAKSMELKFCAAAITGSRSERDIFLYYLSD